MGNRDILRKEISMRKEYDFTNARRSPYAAKLKQQITININKDALEYFKKMAEEYGVPYQTLINLYLVDCKNNNRKLSF